MFQKQRDDKDRRDIYARSKSPQKSFVQNFRSSSNDKTSRYDTRSKKIQIDIAVEVHLVLTFTEITILTIEKDLHLELVIIMIEILLLHITLDHVMIIIKETLDHIVHHTGHHTYRSPYTRDSRPRYKSRSYSRVNNFQKYTSLCRPPSRPRDSRYCRSISHSNTRNKLNNIQPQSPTDPINFEIHIYHPTEMAIALTPTSWFYSLYTHVSPNQTQRDYQSRL